ncbi:MAG: HAD family phosphatase [Candidatus Cloacimonadaceae bacterium]|nr:HAD family phosphatase [Candidatus Cloacimonadaceae bacterium]MDP3115276.1 HAD family phosphatase [Candidatus Cloacimonadaceae bacterium]
MNYKAIIFDLDGTLIDSMRLWREVDTEFLAKRGIEVPADLFAHLPQGNSFIQTAKYFKDRFGLPDSVESVMKEWTDMVFWHYANSIKLKDGALELVNFLHDKQIPIGLGTSNSFELAEKALSFNGIWQCFSSVVTGDMHLMGKPFPDIYLKSAENLKLEPIDCCVVEDTLSGIRAAKAAGMTAIAIFDEDSLPDHDQIKAEADYFMADYFEIRRLLNI